MANDVYADKLPVLHDVLTPALVADLLKSGLQPLHESLREMHCRLDDIRAEKLSDLLGEDIKFRAATSPYVSEQYSVKSKGWQAHNETDGRISEDIQAPFEAELTGKTDVDEDISDGDRQDDDTVRKMSSEVLRKTQAPTDLYGAQYGWAQRRKRVTKSVTQVIGAHKFQGFDAFQNWTSNRLSDGNTKRNLFGAAMNFSYAEEDELARSKRTRREMRKMFGQPKGFAAKATKAADWLDTFHEPRRTGFLANLVHSSVFENTACAVIIFNSMYVAYVADFAIKNVGTTESPWMLYCEYFFVIFYLLELTLRIVVHRLYFLIGEDLKWNFFDLFLVCLSLFDFLLNSLEGENDGTNIGFMRMLRLLKLARILRTLRVMKVFRELAMVLESFRKCLTSLFWSLVMVSFCLYVFSLIFVQAVANFMAEARQFERDIGEIMEGDFLNHFGGVLQCMLSLYMSITGGNDWALYYNIIKYLGPEYALSYLFFTFFFAFALFNILTAIFVEKAIIAAKPESEEMIINARRKAVQDVEQLKKLSDFIDVDCTGTISWQEFEESMSNESMIAYLASVGLEVHDMEMFFQIIGGSKTTELSISDFIEGCMMVKGNATSLDMQRTSCEINLLKDEVTKMKRDLIKVVASSSNPPSRNTSCFWPAASKPTSRSQTVDLHNSEQPDSPKSTKLSTYRELHSETRIPSVDRQEESKKTFVTV